QEKTKIKLAAFEDYDEDDSELSEPSISKENVRLKMDPSYQKSNTTDDPPRDDAILRIRRSPRSSRSLDVFHNSDVRITYTINQFLLKM
ncbi:unnamed protein product, partial [Callosobruchus maculatus]